MTGIQHVTHALLELLATELAESQPDVRVTAELLPDGPAASVSLYLYGVDWPAAGGDRPPDGGHAVLSYVLVAHGQDGSHSQQLLDSAMLGMAACPVVAVGDEGARVEVTLDDVPRDFAAAFWATTGSDHRPAGWYRADFYRGS